MKLESVRLLHAQGVPDHYIANQVYQPVDEDHQPRGSFIILFDHYGATQGAFVASLINTLIREYYRQTASDRLSCFEHALVRINDQIKQYVHSQDGGGQLELHGSIVLCLDNEIHITHIGQPLVYLFRNRTTIPLADTRQEIDESGIPSFSVITSGEVHPNDYLILLTRLQIPETLKDDLQFALHHTPLFEATRAYARLLRQKSERATEAIFIRFNDESDETYQVYVDRSLETTGEKFEQYQQVFQKHGSLIMSGISMVGTKLPRKQAQEKPEESLLMSTEPLEAEVLDASTDTMSENELKRTDEPLATEIEATPYDFKVTTYRQKASSAHAHAKQVEPVMRTNEPVVSRRPTMPKIKMPQRLAIAPRTIYLLVGSLLVLGIVIRIVNALPIGKSSASPTGADREMLITQAEAAQREAKASQVKNEKEKAIASLVEALNLMGQIPDKSQNERSKAITNQAQEMLDSLTKTTYLQEGALPQNLLPSPKKVITAGAQSFVLYPTGSMQKYTGLAIEEVKNIPVNVTFLDAAAYDNNRRIAIMATDPAKATLIYSLDATTGEVKQLARSDNKAWPESKLLSTFDKNLYFVGSTMLKATPSGDKYKIADYLKNQKIDSLTSIVNNGFAFYALEDGKQLVRLAANSPNTAITLNGVPESFLPKTIARILSARKEGVLYLFDRDGQRLIEVSTDGTYREQFSLPDDTKYSDCDATEASFVCLGEDKQIKTFEFSL